MTDQSRVTAAPDGRLRCEHCGVVLPASCPADEGHGCPSWEEYKEQEAARGKQP